MFLKLNVLVTLGAFLCASLAAGATDKEKYDIISNWLTENVEAGASPRQHVFRALEYFNQHKDQMSFDEQRIWGEFVEIINVTVNRCTVASYNLLASITLRAEIVNPDDLRPASRLHMVVNNIARTHSQECETDAALSTAEVREELNRTYPEVIRMAESLDELAFNRLMPKNNFLHPYTIAKINNYLEKLESSPIEFVAGRVSKLFNMTRRSAINDEVESSVFSRFVTKLQGHCQSYLDTFKDRVLPRYHREFHSWTNANLLNNMRTVDFCSNFVSRNSTQMIDLLAHFN